MATEVNDILQHFGVKGMKWGVRRDRSSGVRTLRTGEHVTVGIRTRGLGTGKVVVQRTKSSKLKTHPDKAAVQKSAKKVKRGNTDALSNDELQKVVRRMNLERQFKDISSKEKRTVPGAKFVGDVLLNIGKQQATRLGNQVVEQQLNSLLKKAGAKKTS